jgi:alginate O-acetyltransferase complex protein AlgI
LQAHGKGIISCRKGCDSLTFSNLYFIFAFLPCALIAYYLVPEKYKNYVLLLSSVIFYGLGSWWQTGLLAADTAANYFMTGLFSGKNAKNPHRREMFALTVAANVALLAWFKCHPPIPVGISFYTFQIIAYQIDVYRNDIPRENSLLRFGTYTFLFPKLQEGPITRYDEVSDQLKCHVCEKENLEYGFRIFVVGLSYKILLADKISGLWKQLSIIGYESVSTPMAWLGMWAYTLQLYFDFHGYSLMAIGIGRMFGFMLPKNFVTPYGSTSVSEFYRRWHATLGRWFRDYIYIPLGGSRAGMKRTILNLLVVWTLTGLWHGVKWNFVFWGLSLFVLIAIEKLFLRKWLDSHPVVGHIYLLFVIPLTWMLFANADVSSIGIYFSRLFPVVSAGIDVNLCDFSEYGLRYAPYLLAGVVCLFPQPEKFLLGTKKYQKAVVAILSVLLWVCVVSIHRNASNPFMYLQF